MDGGIYQILYCSRNHIRGRAEEIEAEVGAILRASQRNNAKVGVTGALFYNSVFFAQVLEGSFRDVQRVFERLQLDPRHSDLVVLQSGFVAARDFSGWSMAYAGDSANDGLMMPPSLRGETGITGTSPGGEMILAFLRDVVAKQDSRALPERSSAVRRVA